MADQPQPNDKPLPDQLRDRDQIVMGGLLYCGPIMLAAAERIEQLERALLKVRSYNADIAAGRINYRPEDHIAAIDAALGGNIAACSAVMGGERCNVGPDATAAEWLAEHARDHFCQTAGGHCGHCCRATNVIRGLLTAAPSASTEVLRNAARYEWLRVKGCAIDGSDAQRDDLVRRCINLDEEIDAAMKDEGVVGVRSPE